VFRGHGYRLRKAYKKIKAVEGFEEYLLKIIEGRDVPAQSTKLQKYDQLPFRRPVDCQSLIEGVDTVIRHRIQTHVHRIIFLGPSVIGYWIAQFKDVFFALYVKLCEVGNASIKCHNLLTFFQVIGV
jgi:hypothetical protein